jgi:hypothetical protein
MEFDAGWVATLLTGIGLGGAAVGWYDQRRQRQRTAMPIIRGEWTSDDDGHSARVTIVNRLNEDLTVTRVEAKARLVHEERTYDPGGGIVRSVSTPMSHAEPIDWNIEANATNYRSFRIEGASSPRWLRFTISSSATTLSRKRFSIACSQKP